MSDRILAAKVALAYYVDRIRNSELGQGSAEYAGIIVVAVALIVALLGFTSEIGQQIADVIKNKISELGG